MATYLFVFIASYLANWLLLRTQHIHGGWSHDSHIGSRKIHSDPTMRIGGLAIFAALTVATLMPGISQHMMIISLVAGLPVFLAGFGEDVTKSIRPKLRLAFAFSSAFIFVYWSGYYAQTINTPILRQLFLIAPLAIFMTTISIAGLSNAINFIDGANGLASGCLIIMFGTLAYLTTQTYDLVLTNYLLLHVSAILGFFVWNFPRGRLFLGDGGAYYLGFALAVGLIMAFERNFAISPWTALLIVIYPVTETLFSIYRRAYYGSSRPDEADQLHLHHLVRNFVARPMIRRFGWKKEINNSLTGAMMLIFPLLSCLMAIIGFYTSPLVSMSFVFFSFVSYVAIYSRLSRLYKRSEKRAVKTS